MKQKFSAIFGKIVLAVVVGIEAEKKDEAAPHWQPCRL